MVEAPKPATTAKTDTESLALPHERDEITGQVDDAPRKRIEQAKKDLDAGMVDTDLHGTPGLDAERREQLVPTVRPDGKA